MSSMQPVKLTREFHYAPELIFNAWIKPELVTLWLFVSPTNKILHVQIDERVGGKFSILELNDSGEEIDHFGKYVWIDSPRKLIFTLEVPRHFKGITYVTIELMPGEHGCELHFTQTGVAREVTETNWKTMLDKLDEVLGEQYSQV